MSSKCCYPRLLKVAVASGARSAYGLLRAAIRDDNPVVVLEPRSLYAHGVATVRIGVCSWADEGMVKHWYPRGVSSAADRLRYYADKRKSYPPDIEREAGKEYRYRV